jgi:hypothetical protein
VQRAPYFTRSPLPFGQFWGSGGRDYKGVTPAP